MQKLFHIFVIIIFAPSLLSCMETTESVNLNKSIQEKMDLANITDLYEITHAALRSYDSHQKNSIKDLFQIIEETKKLKLTKIKEKDIGLFAYTQPQLFKEKFMFPNGQFYISVFYDRLRRYNETLEKNKFTHPTIQNYDDYINNITTEIERKKITEQANNFGIFLDDSVVQKSMPPYVDIPKIIALPECAQLINHVHAIRHAKATDIKKLADILYADDCLKKEQLNK